MKRVYSQNGLTEIFQLDKFFINKPSVFQLKLTEQSTIDSINGIVNKFFSTLRVDCENKNNFLVVFDSKSILDVQLVVEDLPPEILYKLLEKNSNIHYVKEIKKFGFLDVIKFHVNLNDSQELERKSQKVMDLLSFRKIDKSSIKKVCMFYGEDMNRIDYIYVLGGV